MIITWVEHHSSHRLLCFEICSIVSPSTLSLTHLRQRGFQLFGQAEVISRAHASFDELATGLREIAGETFPFSSLFRVRVEEIRPIIAPRYRLYPETTEQDQVRDAMRSYGVRPGAAVPPA